MLRGQTAYPTLTKRWSPTLNNSGNPYLKAAIKKHGPEAFQRYVLAECSSQPEVDNLERGWIAILQSCDRNRGYNLDPGGRKGPGRHIENVKQTISAKTKRVWERMSAKDRWEFQLATKLRWLSRTEEERAKIGNNVRKALKGRQRTDIVWNKGLKLEGKPKTEEHRRKIGLGIRRHYEQRRRQEVWMTDRKPPVGTKVERRIDPHQQPAAVKGLKEVEAARRELRELQKRLNQLEFEIKGGCSW